MARAYKKTYLNGAMHNLAIMFDCGVRKYGYSIAEFYDNFCLVMYLVNLPMVILDIW